MKNIILTLLVITSLQSFAQVKLEDHYKQKFSVFGTFSSVYDNSHLLNPNSLSQPRSALTTYYPSIHFSFTHAQHKVNSFYYQWFTMTPGDLVNALLEDNYGIHTDKNILEDNFSTGIFGEHYFGMNVGSGEKVDLFMGVVAADYFAITYPTIRTKETPAMRDGYFLSTQIFDKFVWQLRNQSFLDLTMSFGPVVHYSWYPYKTDQHYFPSVSRLALDLTRKNWSIGMDYHMYSDQRYLQIKKISLTIGYRF